MPTEADAHDAVIDDARTDHAVGCALRLDAETAHLARGKFVQEKHPVLLFAERRAGVVFKTGRTVGVVQPCRQEVGGLAGEMRFPKPLAHPRAVEPHVLVVTTPAAVARLGEVDEALAFARLVGVVIHADEIAVFVKGGLLDVAIAKGINLETTAVGLDAERGTGVGIEKAAALLRHDIQALVADTPIDAAIGSHHQAVHVMTGIAQVVAETVHDDFADVGHAVVVGVLEPPEVGHDRRVDPAVMVHHARGDAGDCGVKTLRENGHLVGRAVAIRVAQLVDPLGVEREILHVDRTVAVVVA